MINDENVFSSGQSSKEQAPLLLKERQEKLPSQACFVSLFVGGIGGHTITPTKDTNTATNIRASLCLIGREVSHAETRLAPIVISEIRIKDFDIKSRRYGSNMSFRLT